MQGREIVDRILQYDSTDTTSESTFLDAVAKLPLDRNDAAGMIFVAEEGLPQVGEDDPFRETIERVVEYRRSDGRYDRSDAIGILHVCREAVGANLAPAPTHAAPRP
jgi:hypothetical protein